MARRTKPKNGRPPRDKQTAQFVAHVRLSPDECRDLSKHLRSGESLHRLLRRLALERCEATA